MYPFPSPFLVSTFAGASLADRSPLGLLLHHPLGRADLPLGHPGGRMGESRVPESHGQPRTFQKMNSLTTASPLPSCWDPRWVGGRGMGQHGSVFRVPAWCILLDSSAPRYRGMTQAGCCRGLTQVGVPRREPRKEGNQAVYLHAERPPLKVAIQTQSWMNVLRCRACSWIIH